MLRRQARFSRQRNLVDCQSANTYNILVFSAGPLNETLTIVIYEITTEIPIFVLEVL